MGEWVGGAFQDPNKANAAIDELIALGYPRDKISLAMNKATRERVFGAAADERAQFKGARGAVAGGAIGGTLGLLVGAAAIVATGGVAAIFVAGPLAAALAAAGTSAAAGGVIGAVAGGGIESEETTEIEQATSKDGIVLAVNARSEDIERVREILQAETRDRVDTKPVG
jgi:hypothetical protein